MPVVSQSISKFIISPLLPQPRFRVYSILVTCFSHLLRGLLAHSYAGSSGCCCFSGLVPKVPLELPLPCGCHRHRPCGATSACSYHHSLSERPSPRESPYMVLFYFPQYSTSKPCVPFESTCIRAGYHAGSQTPLMSLANFVTIREKLSLLQGC